MYVLFWGKHLESMFFYELFFQNLHCIQLLYTNKLLLTSESSSSFEFFLLIRRKPSANSRSYYFLKKLFPSHFWALFDFSRLFLQFDISLHLGWLSMAQLCLGNFPRPLHWSLLNNCLSSY